jgi:ring-1,2-phenylacetyl-CoA epoxidase subunit PaaE
MAVHFHPIRINNIVKETEDCITVSFDIPVELKEQFKFVQGQNITLKTIIEGEEIRRSYSICSSPFENKLTVAIKKVNGGKFSSFANEHLQQNSVIDVLPPTGKFNTKLDASNKKNKNAF